jgi:hypothetical protein
MKNCERDKYSGLFCPTAHDKGNVFVKLTPGRPHGFSWVGAHGGVFVWNIKISLTVLIFVTTFFFGLSRFWTEA